MSSTLRGCRGVGGVRQKWDVIVRRGVWKVSECLRSPVFTFLLKKIGFAPWPNIMLSFLSKLLRKNLPIDSGVREWSYPLKILLHCLWAESNNRMCGEFKYGVTWFCFCFDFVRSRARCGCCYIVCWRG